MTLHLVAAVARGRIWNEPAPLLLAIPLRELSPNLGDGMGQAAA